MAASHCPTKSGIRPAVARMPIGFEGPSCPTLGNQRPTAKIPSDRKSIRRAEFAGVAGAKWRQSKDLAGALGNGCRRR